MHIDAEFALPPRVQARHSGDVDQHALSFDGWQIHYEQLSPGRFCGSTDQLKLQGMQILRDRSNQAMNKYGAAWPGSLTFSLPLQVEGVLHCAGKTIEDGRWLVARGDKLPELRTPANVELLCITVMEQELVQLLHDQNSRLQPDQLPGLYRLPVPRMELELVRLVSELLDPATQACQPLRQSAVCTEIRESVLLQLLDVLNGDEDPTSTSAVGRMRIVAKARELILANPDAPPSILELCHHVGASRRKLQYCFQEALGINPVAYLRMLRLNAARRALCQARAADGVQDIAGNWGFWHLGRFASEYKQLFGEKPSQTLRRVHGETLPA